MKILIGILAFIGAMCIVSIVCILIMAWFDLFPEEPDDSDDDIDNELIKRIQDQLRDEKDHQIF